VTRHTLVYVLALGMISAVIGAGIGLDQRPLFEEWDFIAAYENGQGLFAVQHIPSRPLREIPHFIAYHIDPDSAVGYNLVLWGLFLSRSMLTYTLFRQIFPRWPMVAIGMALLSVVYPAGKGYLTSRTFEGLFAWSMALVSLNLLAMYWRTPRRWLWLAIWGTQIISLLSYELLYLPAFFLPLILYTLAKTQASLSPLTHWRRTSLSWLIPNTILFSWYLWLNLTGRNGYLNRQIDQASLSLDNLPRYLANIPLMMADHWQGWGNIWPHVHEGAIAFLPAWFIMTALLWWADSSPQTEARSIRTWLFPPASTQPTLPQQGELLIGWGLAVAWGILGFLVFIPIGHIVQGFRTYFVSGWAAAFFAVWAMWWIYRVVGRYRFGQKVTLALMSFAICAGAWGMRAENKFYVHQALELQRLVDTLVQTAPDPSPTAKIIVVDEGQIFRREKLGGESRKLSAVLSYLYQRPIQATLCTLEASSGGGDKCQFSAQALKIITDDGTTQFAYSEILLFSTFRQGWAIFLPQIPRRFTLDTPLDYHPRRIAGIEQPAPKRVNEFLGCFPLKDCYSTHPLAQAQEIVYLNFDGQTEALDYPGWARPIPDQTRQWTIGPETVLPVHLVAGPAYLLYINARTLDMRVLESAWLVVGEAELPLRYEQIGDDYLLMAWIAPEYIQASEPTLLTLNFSQTIDPSLLPANEHRPLGIQVDWLQLRPETDPPATNVYIEFEEPLQGAGWERFQVDKSTRWMVGSRAELDLRLAAGNAYRLEFSANALQAEQLAGLQLSVNGREIHLDFLSEGAKQGRWQAELPAESINQGITTLVFTVEKTATPQSLGLNDDTRPLGLNFDWLSLEIIP
jgi:hypothetical protein